MSTAPQPPPPGQAAGKGARRAFVVVLAGDRMGEMFPLGLGTTAIGRGLTADVRINDEGISRTHATVVLEGDVYTLVDNGSTNGTFANGERVSRHALREGDRIQLGANCVFKFTFRDDTEEDLQRRLFESALRDRQTGLFNRGYFLNRLESDVTVALRQGKALSLVLFAVDRHEALRERLGGAGFEHLLRELGQRVQAITREDDVLARYGDALFGLTCRWVDAMRASRAAARIRDAVAREPFAIDDQAIAITLSLGVADLGMPLEASADALVAAADAAMQQATRAGDGRVEIYDPESESTHHT
ncbi:MAG: diguanylate cyclase [Myxococcales bacterium]|nr:diguanylate cyclase [Myxococcales bacterium]MCB9566680.1 diguanylate cyclase [Myxococcales bacterium]MCB9704411.1 diguanylate cyclase [Myxococcales bacterium]